MAYTIDSKSIESNLVRVQVPPPAPERKSQRVLVRLASLGSQFVLDFQGKNEFTILKEEKKNF